MGFSCGSYRIRYWILLASLLGSVGETIEVVQTQNMGRPRCGTAEARFSIDFILSSGALRAPHYSIGFVRKENIGNPLSGTGECRFSIDLLIS